MRSGLGVYVYVAGGVLQGTRIFTVRAVRVFCVAGERSGVRGRHIRRHECRR